MPPRGGRKTIKIPQFKMPQRGSGEIDGMWATLESAINQIFGKEQSKLSYEVLYRNAYNMCLQKQGERLYSSVRQTVSRHLQRQADAVAAQEGDQFMAAMQRQWCDYKLSITMVRDVCMYLDRTWIQQQGVPAVFEMGLELFRDLVVRDGRICSRLLRTMLGYVEREREGEAVPRDVAKSMVDMWWNISPTCYAEDFERPLLQASATYYARVVHDLAAERPARGCAAYFREVGARLEDERARAQRYLHAVTGPKLEGIVHEAMLSVGADSHMEAQLRDPALGLRAQLIGDEHEALALQYELLRASTARGGAALLAELAERELSDYATDTVTDPVLSEDPLRFVGALLAMQRKFEGLLSRAFMRDGELTAVLHRCLGGAINLRDSVAKQMVNFCDALLRKGGLPDPPSEPEVERKLDELVGLYTYLQDKDVFNQYYKRTVAQRLLSETSASEHYERAFVSSVKLQCGAVHMREVEQMLQDAQMSADLQAAFDRQGCSEAFQQQLQRLPALTRGGGQGSAAPALSFRILSERVWPPSWRKDEMLHKPRELTVCLEEIADFYSQRRLGGSGSGSGSGSGAGSGSGSGSGSASASSVRLDWVSAKGRGELYPCYGRFGGKKGTRPLKLDVSVYQAAILLLFNAPGVRTLTLTEIAAQLGMDVENARRYVASLCLGKHKALRKGEGMAPPSAQEGGGGAHRSKSSSKVVGDHDPLRVNEKLASDIVDRRTRKPKSRVSFPVPKRESAKAKAKEDQLAGQAVQEERKYAIEAAVVRTMKMQRTIKMQLLVAEVVAQLSYLFVPDPRYIKRRVADLIDREFLARDDDDPMQLHYVA